MDDIDISSFNNSEPHRNIKMQQSFGSFALARRIAFPKNTRTQRRREKLCSRYLTHADSPQESLQENFQLRILNEHSCFRLKKCLWSRRTPKIRPKVPQIQTRNLLRSTRNSSQLSWPLQIQRITIALCTACFNWNPPRRYCVLYEREVVESKSDFTLEAKSLRL